MNKNQISSLQIYQLIRYSTTLIINIIFAKSYLSLKELGQFEMFFFYFSFVSFFWINGIINALLVNYNSSKDNQILLFNTFLLLLIFSIIAAFFIYIVSDFQTNSYSNNFNLKLLIFTYTAINPISFLIEYIFFLKSKYKNLILYGLISLILQIILIATPVLLKFSLVTCFYGVIVFALFKSVLLFFLLKTHSIFKFDKKIITKQLSFAFPLILSNILAGSAPYIDSFIINQNFDAEKFAVFRYGAKEFPLFMLVANTFSNSILPSFALSDSKKKVLNLIKTKSKKMILIFLPITILLLLFSHILYPIVFSNKFTESYKIFDIYLLLIVSRLVFPQTILTGLNKTKSIAIVSAIELFINVLTSFILIQFYGIIGVAYGTLIAFYSEKLILIGVVKRKLNFKLSEYADIKMIVLLFVIVFTIYFIKVNS